MSVQEKLEWVAIISNSILWGGLVLAFIWLSISDRTLPDPDKGKEQALPVQEKAQEAVEDDSPRHRA